MRFLNLMAMMAFVMTFVGCGANSDEIRQAVKDDAPVVLEAAANVATYYAARKQSPETIEMMARVVESLMTESQAAPSFDFALARTFIANNAPVGTAGPLVAVFGIVERRVLQEVQRRSHDPAFPPDVKVYALSALQGMKYGLEAALTEKTR